jgi:hypothetical protein
MIRMPLNTHSTARFGLVHAMKIQQEETEGTES